MNRIIQNLKHERRYSRCAWFLTGIILLPLLGNFYLNVFVSKAQEPITHGVFKPEAFFDEPLPTSTFIDLPDPTETSIPTVTNSPALMPLAKPDIEADKSVNPSIANPGQNFTFTIKLKNQGSGKADNIVVTDTFPNELSIDSVSCSKACNAVINLNQVVVTIASLGADKNIAITIVTTVKLSVIVDMTLSNTAYLTYVHGANTFSTQTNTVTYQITTSSIPTPAGHPQIYVNKFVQPLSVAAGQSLTITIFLENTGDAQAINIVMQDVFPNILTIDDVKTTKGQWKINQNQVLVTIDALGVDKTVTITIYATVKQNITGGGTFYNTAYITYSNGVDTFSSTSNTVAFQITTYGAGGGLPATGGIELHPGIPGVIQIPITIGLFLVILGASLSIVRNRVKANNSTKVPWYLNLTTILFLSGMILNLTACAIGGSSKVAELIPITDKPKILSTESPKIQITQPVVNISTPTPEALPDYPIPTPPLSPGSIDNGVPKDISPVKRIVIPDIELDTIVKYVPFDGNTWPIAGLKTEVIWMGSTSWPGLGGNTGLSGHVTLEDGSNGPFKYLSKLTAGDQVVLYTEYNKYIYSVRDKQIVTADELSVLEPEDHSTITLVTCSDWNIALKKYLSRLVVYSDLIEVQPIGNFENQ